MGERGLLRDIRTTLDMSNETRSCFKTRVRYWPAQQLLESSLRSVPLASVYFRTRPQLR